MFKYTPAAEDYIKLRKSNPKLLTLLDVSAQLVTSLYAKAVIDENDVEEIDSQPTDQDKAKILLFKIQKKYTSGRHKHRPYKELIQALNQCDQKHVAEMLESKEATETDYDKYNGSFLVRSDPPSAVPGSPRRRASIDSRDLTDVARSILGQGVGDNAQPKRYLNTLEQRFGGNAVPESQAPTSTGQTTTHPEQESYLTTVTAQQWNSDKNIAADSSPRLNGNELLRQKPKMKKSINKNPLYTSSVVNSPCCFQAKQTYFGNNQYRHSDGFEIYYQQFPTTRPPDPVYQSLVGTLKGRRVTNIRSTDFQITDQEVNMAVEEEDDIHPDGYFLERPMRQTPVAVVQVDDFSYGMNSIHAHAHEHAHPGYAGPTTTGTVNTSVLTPTTDSDGQSIDMMNESLDVMLGASHRRRGERRRRRNGECCTIL